jgi:hypothetical protein
MSASIDLTTHKTVRVALSGDVPLTRLETRILDTAPFQRLRAIKQLGTAYLVYPTAVHTRFDHTLGTLAVSLEMMRAIRENPANAPEDRDVAPEQELLIRLFALLHDITHVPFSHIIEDECCILPRHDHDPARLDYFLGDESAIGRILIEQLGRDLYERLLRLFRARKDTLEALGEDCFIHDLVNDTICADMLDYLRRDCYFCNIHLESDYRFLKYLYLRREGGVRRLVIRLWKEGKTAPRRDTLNELIRMLDNRYLLSERVYFHHAKLVAGAMLAGALVRAREAGELPDEEIRRLGDETLLDRLLHSRQGAARRLAEALRERRLWKVVFERNRHEIQAEQERLREVDRWGMINREWHGDPAYRLRMERHIGALLGLDDADLLVHCPHSEMAMKFAGMKVFWNGAIRSLGDCTDDELIGSKLAMILRSHENLWALRVVLHPGRLDRRAAVAAACEGMLTQDAARRARHEQALLRDAARQAATEETLAANLMQVEYEKRLEDAVEKLSRTPAPLESWGQVKEIVRRSFADGANE